MSTMTTISPFVDTESFAADDQPVGETAATRSPFVSAYVLEPEDAPDSASEARRILLGELDDDELEEAIYELAGCAARRTRHTDGAASVATLELEFAPMAREIDAMLDRAAQRLGHRSVDTLAEGELEEALVERPSVPLDPPMEQFFGSIKKAVSKAVKGAATLAKKGLAAAASLGLGPIIARIRKAMPKLLRKIINGIIGRLPAALQADARKLAAALPIAQSEYASDEAERAFDAEAVYQTFNEGLAEAVLQDPNAEVETEAESWVGGRESTIGVGDLDAARERFVSELSVLGDGDDPAPAVEGFIPALIPVLKVAVKLAGRKRLVSLLSSIVSSLITKFVGPQSAKALSSALVDSGLKVVGLEVPPTSFANEAIAATVEDTVRRVAALPDEVLDSRPLAEAAILREFEAAAAANFPPLLPARVYWKRPDLRETDHRRGAWIASPAGRRRKRFKKYSHVVRTRVTPRMAMTIRTFGEAPLADYLSEQLGVDPGETLEADVHLYEAMPGMLLGEVSEAEGATGTEDEYHPLTAEAASLLLGEPGLGQEGVVPLTARSMAVGQRFYRLSVPQRRAVVIPGTQQRRRKSALRLSIDTAAAAAAVTLFLSERRAQEIARALRTKPHAGVTAEGLRPIIDRGLGVALSGRPTGRLRINHVGLAQPDAKGAALKRVPPVVVDGVKRQIASSMLSGLAEFFGAQSARFIAATEDAKDGVTISIAITGLAHVSALRAAIAGQPAPATTDATKPGVTIDVKPGFARG